MPWREVRFVEPAALYALVVVPLLWLLWLAQRSLRNRDRRASGIGDTPTRRSTVSGRRRDLGVLALLTAIAAALVIASARPQAVVRMPVYDTFDLIVLIDRSASMLAADIQPSRLARACLEVQNFLRHKPDTIDRVALVAFASTPIVTSHLTRDQEILGFFLEWMKDDHTRFYGTDIAATLQRAMTVAEVEAPKRRAVVILLSDGEDHGEAMTTALDGLRRAGIPVYAVGVGGDEAVTIPAPRGSETPTVIDDDGRPLLARFSATTLKRVADVTHGAYFRSTSGAELSTALTRIAERERKPVSFREEYRDIAAWPLGAAALLLSSLLVLL